LDGSLDGGLELSLGHEYFWNYLHGFIIPYLPRRKKPGLATGLFFTLNFKGALGAPSRR
jgi:hypothetical protein